MKSIMLMYSMNCKQDIFSNRPCQQKKQHCTGAAVIARDLQTDLDLRAVGICGVHDNYT